MSESSPSSHRQHRSRPPVVLWLLVAAIFLLSAVELGLVDWVAYRAERGRLRAIRESLVDDSPAARAFEHRRVLATALPAVVSIEADYKMPVELRAGDSSSDLPETAASPTPGNSPTPAPPEASPPPGIEELLPDLPVPWVEQGWGSGFVIDADEGHVLTNAHVVAGARDVRVHMPDGQTVAAEVLGADSESDLAVLRIRRHRLHELPLGVSADLEPGDAVYSIGSPFGLEQSVSRGIVSAVNRRNIRARNDRYESLIQTDAVMSPGSSGGPLLNESGEVVGVATAIVAPGGRYQGVGFAVPIDTARRMIPDLIQGGPPFLGVLVWDASDPANTIEVLELGWGERFGAVVDEVYKDTGAADVGIKPGDIILSAAGQRIENMETLGQIIRQHQAGEKIELRIWRDRGEIEIDVPLSRRYAHR